MERARRLCNLAEPSRTQRLLAMVRRLDRSNLANLVNAIGVDRFDPMHPHQPDLPTVPAPPEFAEIPIEVVYAMARRLWPQLMRGMRWPERGVRMPTIADEVRVLGTRAAATIRTQHPDDVKLRPRTSVKSRPDRREARPEEPLEMRPYSLEAIGITVTGVPKERTDRELVHDFIASFVFSDTRPAEATVRKCDGCEASQAPSDMFPCVTCECLFCEACATLELARTSKCERCG